MKKIIFLVLTAMMLGSCSVNDDSTNIEYALAPITGNDLPDSFEVGETYQVTVDYQLPSECYTFTGLDARMKGRTTPDDRRTIYVAAISYTNPDDTSCDDTAEGDEGSSKFSILITEEGEYEFNFWIGEDENGDPEYQTVTVPVEETSPQ